MKLSKNDKRTAKKLVLPLIAIAMMTTMMFMESASRRSHQPAPAKTSSSR